MLRTIRGGNETAMKKPPTSMKERMKVRPVSMKTPIVSMKALQEIVIQSPRSTLWTAGP